MRKTLFTCLLLTIACLSYHAKTSAQCATSSQPTNNCASFSDRIDAFTLNSISASGNSGCGTSGYNSFSSPVWTLTIGQSYSFSATFGNSDPQGFAIWIDLNNNGNYENSEMLASIPPANPSPGGCSGTIAIPGTATAATGVRMRTRLAYNTTIVGGDVCTNGLGTWGETEDYYVTLVAPCPAPSFTSQPSNQQGICEGGDAMFTVGASNASTYQWQLKSGSSWNNVSNGTNYIGATTSTLTVTGVLQSFTGNLYRCVATGNCNNPKNSDSAVLTVNPGVTVTADPLSDTLCRGASTTFNVAAVGSIAGYEWQMAMPTVGVFYPVPNAFPFANVNTATLDILNIPDTLDGYIFRCSVSGGACPDDVSDGASLTVLIAPEITEPPANVTANLHNDAYFSITASDPTVVYYWQASADGISFYNINNGPLYQNVTTPMLIVKSVTLAQAGWWFRCIIKATDPACGTFRDTSDAAQLKVHWPGGINDITAGNMINVYPNPVSGNHLFVQPNEAIPGKLQATIIDNLGRVVYNTEIEFSGTKEVSIPVGQLPAGIYNLRVTSNDGSINSSTNFTRQ